MAGEEEKTKWKRKIEEKELKRKKEKKDEKKETISKDRKHSLNKNNCVSIWSMKWRHRYEFP